MNNTLSKKLNLREKRTFPESISITFEFIKVNIRIISRSFLIFALPLILLGAFFSYLFDFSSISSSAVTPLGNIFISAGALLYSLAINVIVSRYVDMENPSELTISDIWTQIGQNIIVYIGGGFIVGIMVIIGFVLLVIPGIYLGIASSLTFFIIVHEHKGATDSIKRSFDLVKGNWWGVFWFLFVMILIQITIAYSLILPTTFLSYWLVQPLSSGEINQEAMSLFTIILGIIAVISVLFYTFISFIFNVAVAVKYFSIVEEKENTGLQEEIDAMGIQKEEV